MSLRNLSFTWYVILCLTLFGQNNSCPNIDVSLGNFTNWVGFTGTYYAPGANFGIITGRHTIINQPAFDPNTCNQLPMIPPGHNQSIRLGNMQTGAQAEKLSYTISVSPQNSLFVYKYAVVLENPGHPSIEQPKFETRILNAAGMPIGGACGTYTVFGGQPGQNFQNCSGKTWLPWTTVGMDLTPYMGQTIQIEFTTWDCAQGAHFGYAYVVAECQPLSIDVNYCGGNQPLILTAPAGFQSYVWQPGNLTGQQVNINNPNINQIYTCTMTTYSNQGTCSVDLSVQASPTIIQAAMNFSTGCQNQPISIQTNNTITTNAPNITLSNQWIIPNGCVIQNAGTNAQVQFNGPGTQNVILIVQSSNGCFDTLIQGIQVLPTPHLLPQIIHPCINQQTQFNVIANGTITQAIWDFGDGSIPVNSLNAVHTFAQVGTYNISLIETGNNGCIDTLSSSLTIYPLPPINAGPDTIICPGNGITLNAYGGISYTWENGMNQGLLFIPSHDQYLTVVGMDSLHCFNSDSLFVQLFQVYSIHTIPDTSICFGDSIQLTSYPSLNAWWDGGFIENEWVNPNLGMHLYVVHGQDGNGCLSADSMALTILNLPPVYAGQDTVVCAGSNVWLQASGAQNYLWSNAQNNQDIIAIQQDTNLIVIGTDEHGCQQSDTVHIGIDSIPILAFGFTADQGCIPLTTQVFNQSSGNLFTQVTWTFSNGNIVSGDSSIISFTEVGCFDGTITVTTPLGCTYGTTQTQAICTYPLPIAEFSLAEENLNTVQNGTLINNQSLGANTYWWDFGDGEQNSTAFEPYHTFPSQEEGNYIITLVATNAYGCHDTAWLEVHVESELSYYVPNSFTPDGDQFNNLWRPIFSSGLDVYDYHALIYNRWGQVIWESFDANVGWDGRFGENGFAVQDDVYIYQLTFGYNKNAKKERVTGHILVVR